MFRKIWLLLKEYHLIFANIASTIAVVVAVFTLIFGIYTLKIDTKHRETMFKKELYYEIINGFSGLYQKLFRCDISAPEPQVISAFFKSNLIENENISKLLSVKNTEYNKAIMELCDAKNNSLEGLLARQDKITELQKSFCEVIVLMGKDIGLDAPKCSFNSDM